MKTIANVINHPTFITDYDIYLFKQGSNNNLYNKLGSHLLELNGAKGTHFAVWAPNAEYVSVIGDFNGWNKKSHPLSVRWDESGIWEGFIPNLGENTLYKYNIVSKVNNYKVEKGDPFAFKWETPPKTASIVRELDYAWNDEEWLKNREEHNSLNSPMSTYELHIGSWKRIPEQGNRSLNYRELAVELAQYLNETGFTHVEFMPVMEHPFYGSWGYQTTGYFAPTSRYGSPQDFMYLVDYLHQHDIGVILDWVPSHFPGDEFGLHFFDGTHLYEHEDKRKGYHPDWDSYIFNYGRNEVKSFLISSAQFWLDKYHIDALRVDAVASMLYLDYSRNDGEWIPNEHGGNENLEAINLIRELNKSTYTTYPGIQTIAEESTAWPMVSKPTDVGGLGFGMKWNMGWMNDTLEYFSKDPIHRKYYHNMLTFSMIYAFNENFVLSLSHDEVVYFGQWSEWDHEKSLDWHLLGNPLNAGIQKWVSDLNSFYKDQPALYETDFSSEGFEWRNVDDNESSIISFIRKSNKDSDVILVVCNFTPVVRERVETKTDANGGGNNYIDICLPPLGVLFFKFEPNVA